VQEGAIPGEKGTENLSLFKL